jgi:hypothetical protein
VRHAGGVVLEIGAGTGALTRYLTGVGHHVIATDASPDVAVVPGEPRGETTDVLAPLDREDGELQRGNPSLGTCLQSCDVFGGEVQARHLVEVGGRLVVGRTCVPRQFGLAAGALPSGEIGR